MNKEKCTSSLTIYKNKNEDVKMTATSIHSNHFSIYSWQLLHFKSQEHKKPLVQLFELYGLPYNCEFRHAIQVLDCITMNKQLRDLALERCKQLAYWEEDFQAIAQHTSEEKMLTVSADEECVQKIKRFVRYILPEASVVSRKEYIKEIDKLVYSIYQRSGNDFMLLAQVFSILPKECQRVYLKQKLYEQAVRQVKSGHTEEIKSALKDSCFYFIRAKLNI